MKWNSLGYLAIGCEFTILLATNQCIEFCCAESMEHPAIIHAMTTRLRPKAVNGYGSCTMWTKLTCLSFGGWIRASLASQICFAETGASEASASKPNIVFIYADDMGYGDVHCLNPKRGKIPTPQMDKLALEGMVFTDAHTSSSVCTPSRYSLLTGRYCWRSSKQDGVTNGYSEPLIPTDRTTVASLLKSNGYRTAMIGKWHLGMSFPKNGKGKSNINWKGRIEGGPTDLGFDYYFGISASLDMPPYIYIENDQFVGECTTTKAFKRKGPAHKDFEAVNVLDEFADRAVAYIQNQRAEDPFFTYVALNSPHTPILPSPQWQGKVSWVHTAIFKCKPMPLSVGSLMPWTQPD